MWAEISISIRRTRTAYHDVCKVQALPLRWNTFWPCRLAVRRASSRTRGHVRLLSSPGTCTCHWRRAFCTSLGQSQQWCSLLFYRYRRLRALCTVHAPTHQSCTPPACRASSHRACSTRRVHVRWWCSRQPCRPLAFVACVSFPSLYYFERSEPLLLQPPPLRPAGAAAHAAWKLSQERAAVLRATVPKQVMSTSKRCVLHFFHTRRKKIVGFDSDSQCCRRLSFAVSKTLHRTAR